MATPLKDKIRAAAIATPALTAILGTNPFRWFDVQISQGSQFPAVVVQIVSGAPTYVIAGRLPNSRSRVQFTLWGVNTAAGMAALASLEMAMRTFFNQLNLIGISGLLQYPNHIVGARDGWQAATTDPTKGNPQRLLDVMVFANDTL